MTLWRRILDMVRGKRTVGPFATIESLDPFTKHYLRADDASAFKVAADARRAKRAAYMRAYRARRNIAKAKEAQADQLAARAVAKWRDADRYADEACTIPFAESVSIPPFGTPWPRRSHTSWPTSQRTDGQ